MDTLVQDRIVLDPAILAGKPVIRGSRISVEFVIGLLADGWSETEIVENTQAFAMTTSWPASHMHGTC